MARRRPFCRSSESIRNPRPSKTLVCAWDGSKTFMRNRRFPSRLSGNSRLRVLLATRNRDFPKTFVYAWDGSRVFIRKLGFNDRLHRKVRLRVLLAMRNRDFSQILVCAWHGARRAGTGREGRRGARRAGPRTSRDVVRGPDRGRRLTRYRTTQAVASQGSLPSTRGALARRTSPAGSATAAAPKLVTLVSTRPPAAGRW